MVGQFHRREPERERERENVRGRFGLLKASNKFPIMIIIVICIDCVQIDSPFNSTKMSHIISTHHKYIRTQTPIHIWARKPSKHPKFNTIFA